MSPDLRIVLLLSLAVSFPVGCRDRPGSVHEETWPVMGTYASLTVRGTDAATAARLVATARREFADLNARLSLYLPDSELSLLNAAGTNTVVISPLMAELLTATAYYHRISGGAFDPTVTPVVQAWGFSGGEQPVAPPPDAVLAVMRDRIGFEHVQFDGKHLRFGRPGMSLDFGGLAKGLAIDQALLRLTGQYDGPMLLNLGGEMRGVGRPAPSRPWRIGVRNPFNRQEIVGVLELEGGWATATSGNYERFVTLNGVRYSHIMDPRSGHPASGMAGVTVLSTSSLEADALSTALFVMGLEAGGRLALQTEHFEALFIPDRQPAELWATPGFLRHFTPEPAWRNHTFELVNTGAP